MFFTNGYANDRLELEVITPTAAESTWTVNMIILLAYILHFS